MLNLNATRSSDIRTRPLVSIVIAAYNAEEFLANCLQSVSIQSPHIIEIIVCDDFSSDHTASIARSFEALPVRVVQNSENLGPGRSRDHAISVANGEWVALLDADDFMQPQRIRELLEAGKLLDADVIFDDTMLCHERHGRLIPWKKLHGTDAFGGRGITAREVAINDYVSSPRLLIHPLIRTYFIRKHGIRHSSRRFAEDAEFYLRLALAGAKFAYVPEPLYHYRIAPGSLTAQAKDPTLMRKCLEECSQWEGWSPAVQEAFGHKITSLRHNEALYDLRRAVRQGQLTHAFKLLATQPHLLTLLPSRIFQQFRYQAHRISHGGIGR